MTGPQATRLIGLDPGLRHTGWGVIDVNGNHLRHVANGAVASTRGDLSERLMEIHAGLNRVIAQWVPQVAAVEETFVNKNPVSTLKLGQARGAVLLTASLNGLGVTEYAPNAIKKAVVGSGHAAKRQIRHMVEVLLPGTVIASEHAADALAVAICHAHHAATRDTLARRLAPQGAS